MMNKTKKMTTITMLVALSVLFHMVESMIPLPLPVPGFRLGLANIVGLIALYLFNFKIMIGVNLTRVIFASLLKGTLFGTGFYEDMKKGVFSTIGQLPKEEPRKGSIAASAAV